MWSLGWQETMFIFLLALLIFGPKKLPELGKNIAKGLAEFRRHSADLKATFDREMANIERETSDVKQDLQKVSNEVSNEVSNYDSYYENSYYDSGYDGTASTEGESGTQTSTDSASATLGAESSAPADTSSAGNTVASNAAPGGDMMRDVASEGNAPSMPVQEAEAASDTQEPEGKPVARA
jgi:TatA/E family protein of Tat protein translocase